MIKCPLKVGQQIFQIHRITANPISIPTLVPWTVIEVHDKPETWHVMVQHHFNGEEWPQGRTVDIFLWDKVYHPTIAAAVEHELIDNRRLIDDLYKYIGVLKNYLYAVEKLGIKANVDIF